MREAAASNGPVEKLADDIEFELYRMGNREIPSSQTGGMVMKQVLRMDHIAYIRV